MVSSGWVLALIVAAAVVAATCNVALSLVEGIDTKKRGALLILLALFSVIAAVATTVYPPAIARDEKKRLARDAKILLMPEIQQNSTRVANMLNILAMGRHPIDLLDTAAWQTVSSGGLLAGLDAEDTSKLLRIYSLVFQVNSIDDHVRDATAGVRAILGDAEGPTAFVERQLQARLAALQQAFSELDKTPQRDEVARPTRRRAERPWHF
jgi:hypothetical protein